MHITRVFIQNYRCLENSPVELNPNLNIVVGDNECGKSTFLEAIYLALTFQLNGRSILSELHPHLFNAKAVRNYVAALKAKKPTEPPKILIEVYFADDPQLSALKGTNNSRRDDVPGVKLCIEFNPEYSTEYATYISTPEQVRAVPIEYYRPIWRNFAGNDITSRSIPIRASLIDASTIRNDIAANRYVLEMVKGCLEKKQHVELALSYRLMKDRFLEDTHVKAINTSLAAKKGDISEKTVSVSLDSSSRSTWEAGVVPHLDDVPMPLVGKGEQNSVKIKLAMESAEESNLFLIEEPENHLSFPNLNALIKSIADRKAGKQLILTTLADQCARGPVRPKGVRLTCTRSGLSDARSG